MTDFVQDSSSEDNEYLIMKNVGNDKDKNMKISKNGTQQEKRVVTKEQQEEIYNAKDMQCGLGFFKPKWLQKLRSKKMYLFTYGFTGLVQMTIGCYYIGTLSTIEKQFKIPSRTSGIISSSWDFGTLIAFLFTSYFGGKGHKTRWVAMCTVILGFSCLYRMLPYILFGPGEDALQYTEEYGVSNNISLENALDNLDPLCGSPFKKTENCETSSDTISVVILVTSAIIMGIGCSSYWSLGAAYLDDNVKKDKLPVMLAAVSFIRMMGPTLGFTMASYCLLFYVDPFVTPTITSDSNKWIGNWWVGWIPLAICNFLCALLMAFFPRKLPRAAIRKLEMSDVPEEISKETSFQDFKSAISRLWNNKIYFYNTLSSISYLFGMIGYWTYMPKYLETQFLTSASNANIITGSVGLLCSAIGVLTSGAVITKFKPRPRFLAGWNCFTELLDGLAHFSLIFLGCPDINLHGTPKLDQTWETAMSCNLPCACSSHIEYTPVCSIGGNMTFFSACHAGCTNFSLVDNVKTYFNCSCVDSGMATSGVCEPDCGYNFMLFITVLVICNFLSATGRAGNTIIQFRCVSEQDKALSIGINEAVLCALGFIPGPIVYGMFLDASCLVWGHLCDGDTGNCWLYRGSDMRFVLNLTGASFILLSSLLDLGVWYNSKHLKMYDDDFFKTNKKKNKDKEEPTKEKSPKMLHHIPIEDLIKYDSQHSLRRNSLERT